MWFLLSWCLKNHYQGRILALLLFSMFILCLCSRNRRHLGSNRDIKKNYLDCDWLKKLLFSSNSPAKLYSNSFFYQFFINYHYHYHYHYYNNYYYYYLRVRSLQKKASLAQCGCHSSASLKAKFSSLFLHSMYTPLSMMPWQTAREVFWLDIFLTVSR